LRVRQEIGAFARLEAVIFINKFPKTRSGKILRKIIKKIINGESYIAPGTIEDISLL
jgi:propionyl-CoA synthetase